jgi:hypothetical protein
MKTKNDKMLKDKILTLRLDEVQEEYIENARIILENSRGPGARRVSKTEAALILFEMAMVPFNKKYGNPIKR